jgi:methylamine dehydrogenase heavy chain
MNPGHSISIVDVADRIFVYEISTPGCAVTMPVGENDLLQVCGDGTLQLIQLDASGYETNRVRSEVFFDVIEDPIFDRVTRSRDGWFLITHSGNIFEVRTEGEEIIIEDGWGLHDETHWRPGARNEVIASHENLGLVYVIMHEGEVDTHHVNGNEIWVYDAGTKKRIHRLKLDSPAGSIMVTQEDEPKLIVAAEGVDVYNALTFTHERTIEAPDAQNFEDF